MLTHLSIRNFTLVDSLDLELASGMTVITGETGAGKSILLDALALTLGDRADADRVRVGAERADIHATFDISTITQARTWLAKHELDEGGECILRRTVSAEGRSRGFINGQPATLQQLRDLGEILIDIHSQHAHQSLLKKDNHRLLLDDFGQLDTLVSQVADAFKSWQKLEKRYQHQLSHADDISARYQLLHYQVQELDSLALGDDELEALETEQRTLAHAEEIMRSSQQILEICNNDEHGLNDLCRRALHILEQMPEKTPHLQEASTLLASAQVNLEEASSEVDRHMDSFELNPQRLLDVEERLSSIYEVARKHRIQPEEIPPLHHQLAEELANLQGAEGGLEAMAAEVTELKGQFDQHAEQLSQLRQAAAHQLSADINQQLQALAMSNANLSVTCVPSPTKPNNHGIDDIEFLISTNPGQPPRPLGKVASGGELSRISLAIQVVLARHSTIPTLVFDEVDVGIGGATGEVVGELLRQLGQQGQVLCVTHLAQVASKGHHHLQVHKTADEQSAQTTLTPLEGDSRIAEIARMMSGTTISEQSLAHAREMTQMSWH